jgi:hypothetical protein
MQKEIKTSYYALHGQIERLSEKLMLYSFKLLSRNLRRGRKASYFDLS